MVQSVRLELSALNALPGVSGVEDVDLDVPQVDDIEGAVRTAVPGAEDIADEVEFRVRQALEDLDLDPQIDLPEVEFPAVETLAEELVEELTGLDGFFGPVEDDFRRALEEALVDPEITIDGLSIPTDDILTGLEDVQQAVEALEVPTTDELEDAVATAVTDALEEALPAWVRLDLEALLDEVGPRVRRRIVSDESLETLEEALGGGQ